MPLLERATLAWFVPSSWGGLSPMTDQCWGMKPWLTLLTWGKFLRERFIPAPVFLLKLHHSSSPSDQLSFFIYLLQCCSKEHTIINLLHANFGLVISFLENSIWNITVFEPSEEKKGRYFECPLKTHACETTEYKPYRNSRDCHFCEVLGAKLSRMGWNTAFKVIQKLLYFVSSAWRKMHSAWWTTLDFKAKEDFALDIG